MNSEPNSPLPAIIIGAGAAGLMAACFAAQGKRPVIVLERSRDGGRKILISGGGRCNILPSVATPERFVTDSSTRSLRNMLLAWPLAEQRRFFEEQLDLPLALEPETGKLFPASNRARDVRDRLIGACRQRGVQFLFESTVVDLEPPGGESPEDSPWQILLADGRRLAAWSVVLATGGLSVPKTGSDGMGLEIARRLGHQLHATYPALAPLTANPTVHAPLSGIALDVEIVAPLAKGQVQATGALLFTHRGYSGPVVLDISHMAVRSRLAGGPRQPLLVRWTSLNAPQWDDLLRTTTSGTVAPLLRRDLPARLASMLAAEAGVPEDRSLSELRRDERRRLVEMLTQYPLPWTGDEGYKKAEVTGGGVPLGDVRPRTMESRAHARLHFCGEILDSFGPIGGHNFQWAWATGRTAGLAAGA